MCPVGRERKKQLVSFRNITLKTNPLTVFNVDLKMNNIWMSLVNRKEFQNSPNCFIGTNVTTSLVYLYFITWMVQTDYSHASLVYILTYIFDEFHRATKFHIDMCIENAESPASSIKSSIKSGLFLYL
eukprot:GHVR01116192.1.p1 GENE.GHVR01116192.1~~GHVR01116192.1.p1  ORF type:complete len:128 (-),score=1.04 GHVR01116192.1:449-832(-)